MSHLVTRHDAAQAARMETRTESTDLTGKLLVAMPSMGDPRFEQSVIFMCSYSSDGAMGLIVNKALPELKFTDVLMQLEIELGDGPNNQVVHIGGPVERGRGFVLHSSDYSVEDATLEVRGGYGMTATRDILVAISKGEGPSAALMAMGYSSWGPGQLEDEIQRNGWLICDASQELVFGSDNSVKWLKALATLGIDPLLLSAEGGYA